MSSPQYSVVFSAPVAGTVTAGNVGDVLIPDVASGLYIKATTANRGTRRSTGIALSAYTTGGVTDIQQFGQVDTVTAGLGTGAASWVRVSATGSLERATVSGSDDVVGWVETDGTLHAVFGYLTAAIVNGGGGGGTVPTGTGIPHIVGGAQNAAASLIVDADVTAVGVAKLTGLGTGVATFLGTPSGANLGTALTGTLAANKVVQATGTGIPHVVAGALSAASSLIVNADVNAAAAIAVSKLAPSGTAGDVLTTTGGVPVWAAPVGGGGLGANVTSGTSYVSIGPSAAATGALRLANAFSIVWADNVAADAALLNLDVGNQFNVGTTAYGMAIFGSYTQTYATGSHYMYAASAQMVSCDGTTYSTAVPMVGLNSPWGAVDGLVQVAVAASNITLTSAQYNTKIQKFTGAPAAARTITYPLPADDAHSYVKIVWAATTVSGVTATVGVGTNVTVAVGTAGVLLFTPTGVVRIT